MTILTVNEIKERVQPILATFGLDEIYLFRRSVDANH